MSTNSYRYRYSYIEKNNVLLIRDILLRIQILIFSVIGVKDANKKYVFCLLLFEGTLHQSLKIKSHKTVEMKVFLTYFA
jgi:hypothetical protein